MPILGWLVGTFIGFLLAITIFAALALPIPALLGSIVALVGMPVPVVSLIIAIALLAFFYLLAYLIATISIAGSLPAVTLPLAVPVATPGGVPAALPAIAGESFARGMMIGMTAALNAAVLSLIPIVGPILATWAFVLVSLATITFIARNRLFQGFLGWSAWLFPISYFGTAVGLLLFLVNVPFSLGTLGIGAFRIDWSTGVIETAGGLAGITGFTGGFSLGNFNFVTSAALQGFFLAPSVSSHETGHTLNTAALSGVMLWINAIDENIPPFRRLNLAYGELTAESHTMALPGPPRLEFFVRLWG